MSRYNHAPYVNRGFPSRAGNRRLHLGGNNVAEEPIQQEYNCYGHPLLQTEAAAADAPAIDGNDRNHDHDQPQNHYRNNNNIPADPASGHNLRLIPARRGVVTGAPDVEIADRRPPREHLAQRQVPLEPERIEEILEGVRVALQGFQCVEGEMNTVKITF